MSANCRLASQRAQVTFDDRIVFVAHEAAHHVVQIELRDHPERRSVRLLSGERVVASDARSGGTWELHLPDGDYELLDAASTSVVRFSVDGGPQRVTA